MGRLIDADALKKEVEFRQEHMWPEDLSFRIPGMIDNAPTVPAIPVEWLRKQGQHGSVIQVSATILIEKWQKEQEAQDGTD